MSERDHFEVWAASDHRCIQPNELEERSDENNHYYDHDTDNAAFIGWKAARAALRSLPEWQPIETAPKDGSSVLLFEPDGLGRFVGYWNVPRQAFAALTSVWETEPTYWQPLPQPPHHEQQVSGSDK
jgi:hypothetical protein